MNQPIPIAKTKAYASSDEVMIDHLLFSLKTRDTEIRDPATFYRILGTSYHKDWGQYVAAHYLLFSQTAYKEYLVVQRLLLELQTSDLPQHLGLHPDILQQWRDSGKSTLEYLVEELGLMGLHSQYQVFKSRFEVLFSSKLLNRSVLEFNGDYVDVKVNFDEVEYSFNGVRHPHTQTHLEHYGGIIECRYPKLFGSKLVWEQRVENGVANTDCSNAFIDAITITEDDLSTRNFSISIDDKKQENISEEQRHYPFHHELRRHWFAVQRPGAVQLKTTAFNRHYNFQNIQDFRIPLVELVPYLDATGKQLKSLNVALFASIPGVHDEFSLIKTILCPGALVKGQTVLSRKLPLELNQKLYLKRFEEDKARGGRFNVISTSSITIGEEGGIDGSGYGLRKDSKYKSTYPLKYGQFNGDLDTQVPEQGTAVVGGGVISLFAVETIMNSGVLVCESSNKTQNVGGGSIFILSAGSFVNDGRISCGEDGMIRIFCREFVNRGLMTPVPFIQINDGQSLGFGFKALVPELKGKRMKLSVVEHRGHSYGWNHPRNLLESGYGKLYYSSSTRGPPNEDWIVFRMRTVRPMSIIGIGIRNSSSWHYAIERISIEGSADGKAFEHWIQINDIKTGKDELQRFDVDIGSSHYAVANEWKFYKMRILENYGWNKGNEFYEVGMFGVGV